MKSDILHLLADNLKDKKNIPFEIDGDTLYVFPTADNGFAVWLKSIDQSYRVGFNGWHVDFSDADAALACFKYGLCGDCELKESRWGDRPYRWTVIYHQAVEHPDDCTTSTRFIPFWRKHQDRFLRNDYSM